VVIQNRAGDVLVEAGRYLGHATNNVAEYGGLIGCLELVKPMKAESLDVYSDSELLVRQVQGAYRVKKPHLKELHGQVLDMIDDVGCRFQIHHIPREKNRVADGLARRAIHLRSDIHGPVESPRGQSG